MSTMPKSRVPSHVPAGLVREDYPFVFGATTTLNPFKDMVPKVHEGPDIIYSTGVYPGHQPAWVPRRLEDLRAIYLDTDHFSSKGFSPFARLIGEHWNQLPAEMDPPEHAAYRALLNPLFAPKKLQALEPNVRRAARQFIEKFKDKGECEFMSEFAFRFPILVVLDLLDLPHERMEEFLEWEGMLLHSNNLADVVQGTRNVTGYLREVIAERRRNPGEDFISFGVQSRLDGRPLTDDELMGYVFNLYIGGLDTVSTNIAWHFRHLAEHPEHQARLRAEPEIVPVALEELFRAYAAVTTFRTCVKEQKVHGITMLPGDKVAMATTLGNTDPSAWERPGEVLLDRSPAHVTFAYGPHRCIGSHLARREAQIALEEFFAAIPTFHLKPGAVIETSLGGVLQPKTLPLVWG